MQHLLDVVANQARQERSRYHLTLGELIDFLRDVTRRCPGATVSGLTNAGSYRGYYADLAFELGMDDRLARDLLSEAEVALSQSFTGYKGGDFVMGEDTPLWQASYGTSNGFALLDVNFDEASGHVSFVRKDVSW